MPTDSLTELDAARFAAIVANSSDAIVSKSLDGIVESWNPAAERLFGWSAEEMIGQSIRRIIPDDLHDEEDAILARLRTGELVPKFETRRRNKDGEEIPIAVTVSPVRDPKGNIVGASKIANDLRDQQALSRGLKQKSAQFAALADNIPQLAWIADDTGWIYWYNKRWYDFTGTTLKEMEGWGWQGVHHPDHVDRVTERIKKAFDSGEPWEDTFPLRRYDGTYCWFLSRANPLRDQNGDILLWCGTNTDITDQREAGERIALLMQEVNHRARNMLAIIQAMINRSAGRSTTELTAALKSRIRALASSQELLNGGDWSGARIRDVIASQMAHLAQEARVRIDLSGPADLVLKAQPAEALGLAIHELATNAVAYGALSAPDGRVDVSWSLTGDQDSGNLSISWQESGGPEVDKPLATGFGTILIKRNIELAFGSAVDLQYSPTGLVWHANGEASRLLTEEIESVEIFKVSLKKPGKASRPQ